MIAIRAQQPGRLRFLAHNAMHGISWNAMFRMWATSHKTPDDWRREADVRQSAIIVAGLQLGIVVPNGRGGYEVRP